MPGCISVIIIVSGPASLMVAEYRWIRTVTLYYCITVELGGSPYASQGRLLLWLPPAASVNIVLDEGKYA